ncbi:hypothetical protein [Bradyrhizobium sp. SRS-191]|uniref:hypothetical protein n=1 Tax=Bradyrhizobium sp. SRS-191 TaxID=2962606 RepID=UPI00211E3179|nr:hypothetical protein [Bradyrhizobium sp. SRS-191]
MSTVARPAQLMSEAVIFKRYVALVAIFGLAVVVALSFCLSLLSFDGWKFGDALMQIPRQGNPSWYRDFGGRNIPQIQDQDIFYSNLGGTVDAARQADIVFLGPSFVSYALDRQTLQESPAIGGLNIFNMAFVGVRGGEFSRQVIKRWSIRPRLWVINADDQFVHFFSNDLNVTLGPEKQLIAAAQRNRLRGYLTVLGRNLHWRIEDAIAAYRTGQFSPSGLYRNVVNGDMGLDANPGYVALGNRPMLSARDPDCHTNQAVIDYAKAFVGEVGGEVLLTLVPHSQSCVQQAAELAKALNVELIAPPFNGLTTIDGGGHLDQQGAKKFTSYLVREIVNTSAFKRAFQAGPRESK